MLIGQRVRLLFYLFMTFSSALAVDGLTPGKKAATASAGDNAPVVDLTVVTPKLPSGALKPITLPLDPTIGALACFVAQDSAQSGGHADGQPQTKNAGASNLRNLLVDPKTRNQYFVGVQDLRNETQPIQVLANAPAVIVPAQIVRVTPRVPGQVLEVLVEEGTKVKVGQVLARLDRTVYSLEHKRALALLERARARVAGAAAKVGTHQAETRQAEAALQEAMAQRDSSSRKLSRMRDLVKSKSITEQLAAEANDQFEAADARVRQAQAAVKVRQASVQMETVAAAKADVAYAEAQVDLAKYRLDCTEMRALSAGTVLTVNVQVGSGVGPPGRDGHQLSIFEIADLSHLDAVADLPDNAAAQRIIAGSPCEIRLDAVPATVYKGRVWRVSPTVRRSDRTLAVRVKLDLPEGDQFLRPGMYAVVRLLPKK